MPGTARTGQSPGRQWGRGLGSKSPYCTACSWHCHQSHNQGRSHSILAQGLPVYWWCLRGRAGTERGCHRSSKTRQRRRSSWSRHSLWKVGNRGLAKSKYSCIGESKAFSCLSDLMYLQGGTYGRAQEAGDLMVINLLP
jgi:hypothetical protein